MKIRRNVWWLLRRSWQRGFAVFLPLLKPTGLSGPGWELWFPFRQLHSAFRNGCLSFVQVVIEGTRGPSYLGDIGIDDIGFSNFPCHPATSQCCCFLTCFISTLVHMHWLMFQTSFVTPPQVSGRGVSYWFLHLCTCTSWGFKLLSPGHQSVFFSLFFLFLQLPLSAGHQSQVFSTYFDTCAHATVKVSNFPCHQPQVSVFLLCQQTSVGVFYSICSAVSVWMCDCEDCTLCNGYEGS